MMMMIVVIDDSWNDDGLDDNDHFLGQIGLRVPTVRGPICLEPI